MWVLAFACIALVAQTDLCKGEDERAKLLAEYNAAFGLPPTFEPPPPAPAALPGPTGNGSQAPAAPSPPPPPPVAYTPKIKPSKKEYLEGLSSVRKGIKKSGQNWVAGINPVFENITDYSELLGAVYVPIPPEALPLPPPPPGVVAAPAPPPPPPPPQLRRLPPKRGGGTEWYSLDGSSKQYSLPASYDIRKDYPECTSITSVRDQINCGACYAFATASVMSDRHCMYNYQKSGQVFIAPYHLLSCVGGGCKDGGDEADAMAYWKKKGLVTGAAGDYWSPQPDGCMPLPSDPKNSVIPCPTTCTNSRYNKRFDDDRTYGGASGRLWFPSVQWMQNEIYKYGPIVAFLSVYDNFKYYRGGVYESISGNYIGPHTVKLIGWGTEGGVDYWLAVNSWGTSFGDRGVFKIKRGSNVAQIEARISWALPKEAIP